MGLRSMQQELQQSKQQESSLIERLTEANSSLQEQVQSLESQNSSLKAELTEAYKQIRSLSSSDLQLKQAQQLKASAAAELESSRQLMRDAEQQKQLNEQNSRDLQSKEQRLKEQQRQLNEQEKNLAATIGAYKKQAQNDAAAELASGWQKLKDAQDVAEKEQAKAIQQAEDLKAAAQRELESAQKAISEAQEKGYHDTVRTYTLAIRAMMLFCVVLGLIEVVKHWYIFTLYFDWSQSLIKNIGLLPAAAVTLLGSLIFFVAYFLPFRDSNGLYFGLTIRLIFLVALFALADAVPAKTAAIIIYLSCFVVGGLRCWLPNNA